MVTSFNPKFGDQVKYRGDLYYCQPLYDPEVPEPDISLPFYYCYLYVNEQDLGKAWKHVFHAPLQSLTDPKNKHH